MRVVEQTADRLVLEMRPVALLKTRGVTLERPSRQLKIASHGILGRGETNYPLADLQGASLAANRSNNSGTTYRAVLHFRGAVRDVPVTPYSTSGPGPSQTVNAINGRLGPRVTVGAGQAINLSGAQAQEALATLEKLGIKLPR